MNNIVCFKNIMAPLACAFYFFALKSSKRAKKPALLHLKSVLPRKKKKMAKGIIWEQNGERETENCNSVVS